MANLAELVMLQVGDNGEESLEGMVSELISINASILQAKDKRTRLWQKIQHTLEGRLGSVSKPNTVKDETYESGQSDTSASPDALPDLHRETKDAEVLHTHPQQNIEHLLEDRIESAPDSATVKDEIYESGQSDTSAGPDASPDLHREAKDAEVIHTRPRQNVEHLLEDRKESASDSATVEDRTHDTGQNLQMAQIDTAASLDTSTNLDRTTKDAGNTHTRPRQKIEDTFEGQIESALDPDITNGKTDVCGQDLRLAQSASAASLDASSDLERETKCTKLNVDEVETRVAEVHLLDHQVKELDTKTAKSSSARGNSQPHEEGERLLLTGSTWVLVNPPPSRHFPGRPQDATVLLKVPARTREVGQHLGHKQEPGRSESNNARSGKPCHAQKRVSCGSVPFKAMISFESNASYITNEFVSNNLTASDLFYGSVVPIRVHRTKNCKVDVRYTPPRQESDRDVTQLGLSGDIEFPIEIEGHRFLATFLICAGLFTLDESKNNFTGILGQNFLSFYCLRLQWARGAWLLQLPPPAPRDMGNVIIHAHGCREAGTCGYDIHFPTLPDGWDIYASIDLHDSVDFKNEVEIVAVFRALQLFYNRLMRVGANRTLPWSLPSSLPTKPYCKRVLVHTTSEYVIKGFHEGLPKWRVNGFKTNRRTAVVNMEWWMALGQLTQLLHGIGVVVALIRAKEADINVAKKLARIGAWGQRRPSLSLVIDSNRVTASLKVTRPLIQFSQDQNTWVDTAQVAAADALVRTAGETLRIVEQCYQRSITATEVHGSKHRQDSADESVADSDETLHASEEIDQLSHTTEDLEAVNEQKAGGGRGENPLIDAIEVQPAQSDSESHQGSAIGDDLKENKTGQRLLNGSTITMVTKRTTQGAKGPAQDILTHETRLTPSSTSSTMKDTNGSLEGDKATDEKYPPILHAVGSPEVHNLVKESGRSADGSTQEAKNSGHGDPPSLSTIGDCEELQSEGRNSAKSASQSVEDAAETLQRMSIGLGADESSLDQRFSFEQAELQWTDVPRPTAPESNELQLDVPQLDVSWEVTLLADRHGMTPKRKSF